MKKTLRMWSAFLAVLFMSSALASCGGSDTTLDTTANSGNNGTDTTAPDTSADSAYPELEIKSFGGEDVNILIRTEWNYEFMIDEETGDTVSDAIYKRNSSVEDKYDCNLNFIDFKGDWANHDSFTSIINKSVLAGDGAYDFIAGYQAVLTTNIQNGDLMNLYDVPHLQLDAPWWTQEGVESLTYNGICYQVGGDIAVSLLEGIFCMFYNKTLAENYKIPDLYEIVNNNEWTHDKMLEVTKDVYSDLNANETKDLEDSFGMVTPKSFIRTYLVTYDTPTISTDGKLVWNNERTIGVVEKLVDAFAQNDLFYDNAVAEKIFTSGRALLMNTTLGAASRLRAMDDDFGIIPYPMYDKSQGGYYTTTSNEVSMICVPVTAPDLDKSGLIIEAMCRESTDTVAKSFYEVALKGKYTRDENSAEMIDKIRASLTFDFGWIGSMATGVSGSQYQTMVEAGDKAFATWYAANEASINERVSKYLEAYAK